MLSDPLADASCNLDRSPGSDGGAAAVPLLTCAGEPAVSVWDVRGGWKDKV